LQRKEEGDKESFLDLSEAKGRGGYGGSGEKIFLLKLVCPVPATFLASALPCLLFK